MNKTRNIRVMVSAFALGLAAILIFASTLAARGAEHVRWDILTVEPSTSTMDAGGVAFAKAVDGSMIKMTGMGTFVASRGRRGSNSSTHGGGTWETFDPDGKTIGSGVYRVTGLVHWSAAPGADPSLPFIDNIGDPEEWSAGLLVLRIEYSDGEKGTLTVNCSFPASPPAMPEGISATKDFVHYFDLQTPGGPADPFVDANRTLFHVRQ